MTASSSLNWRIDVDHDCRLDAERRILRQRRPPASPSRARSTVSSSPPKARSRPATRRACPRAGRALPADVFLRDTPSPAPTTDIRDFAGRSRRGPAPTGSTILHAPDAAASASGSASTSTPPTPAPARPRRSATAHGVCQDFAHVFIAAARHLGIPARYVSGYLYRERRVRRAGGRPRLGGGVRRGPRLGRLRSRQRRLRRPRPMSASPSGSTISGRRPVRGTRYGGTGEALAVRVVIEDTARTQAMTFSVATVPEHLKFRGPAFRN